MSSKLRFSSVEPLPIIDRDIKSYLDTGATLASAYPTSSFQLRDAGELLRFSDRSLAFSSGDISRGVEGMTPQSLANAMGPLASLYGIGGGGRSVGVVGIPQDERESGSVTFQP
jgi:hypothetical protein